MREASHISGRKQNVDCKTTQILIHIMNVSVLCWKSFGCFLKIKWLLCCFSGNIPAFMKFMKVAKYDSVLAVFMTFIEITMIFHMSWSFFISFFTLLAYFLHPLSQFRALLTFTILFKVPSPASQPADIDSWSREALNDYSHRWTVAHTVFHRKHGSKPNCV